jgi:SAM-dependent methyltransferase
MKSQKNGSHLTQQQQSWLNNAIKFCDSGQHQQAHKLAQRILKQSTNNDSAEFIIALYEEKSGRTSDAIKYCRRAVEHAPHHRDYRAKLAALLIATNALDEAEKLFAELHKEGKSDTYPIRGLTKICGLRGDVVGTYNNFLKLKRLNALSENEQSLIIESLSMITADFHYKGLANDLSDFLDYTHINPNKITHFLGHHFCEKYNLKEENQTIGLEELLNDHFLQKALKIILFTSPQIEELLTNLRKSLLTEISSIQTIPNQLLPLIEALAIQNNINEFVHFISADEKEILGLFEKLLITQTQENNWSPSQSELVLLCLSLYGRLYDFPVRDQLLSHPLDSWPEPLKNIARMSLFEIDDEIKKAAQIPTLTPIDDETSLAVRAQYEDNPYPRWSRPQQYSARPYGQYMANLLPGYVPPRSLLQKRLNALIAGCGTGRQPIEFAIQFPNTKITAVDISRRSLAHAQRKAQEFGITNIDFYHGDILKLDQIDERFDLIQCSGVIHHMAEPLRGWRILRDLLAPGGILQLDLYSRIARQEISQHREAIESLEIKSTPEDIRRYRQLLIEEGSHPYILTSTDFWSLSPCRDLLFHCQEHQFTWPEIQECCDQLDMEFVGLHAHKPIFQLYHDNFPSDPDYRNLENWHQFELNNPKLFGGMYSFWCKRK